MLASLHWWLQLSFNSLTKGFAQMSQKDSNIVYSNFCFNDVRFGIISILPKTKQITLNSVP